MHKYVRKILSPIFSLIARPGLPMPHDGYTPELLLAGVKPLGFPQESEMNRKKDLDAAVERGQLISLTLQRTRTDKFHIYAHAGADVDLIKAACEQFAVEHGGFAPVMGISSSGTISGIEYKNTLHADTDEKGILSNFEAGIIDAFAIENSILAHKLLPEDISQQIEKIASAKENIVIEHEFTHNGNSLTIYGQKGQENNIRLFFESIKRYDVLGSDKRSPEDYALEGRLLGYTEKDIQHRSRRSSNQIKRKIVYKSEGFRRWCRAQAMLAKATAIR